MHYTDGRETTGCPIDYRADTKPHITTLYSILSGFVISFTCILLYFSATRRRPIKGAAGRPVQYKYPDSPVSPRTLERREVEHRLVPIQIQIVVFFIVACLLYLIYDYVEDNSYSPFVALLDSLNQGSDSEEGLLLQSETEVTPALSGQE